MANGEPTRTRQLPNETEKKLTPEQGKATDVRAITGPIPKGVASSSGIITGLAGLPDDAIIDAQSLATIVGRCKKSIQRAAERDELPKPMRNFGKQQWLVSAIREHFRSRQAAAIEQTVSKKGASQ